MKKVITILATLMLTTMTINFAKAEGFAVGVTGAYSNIQADGTETEGTAADTSVRTADVDNNVFIGSVFAEYGLANVSYANSGFTFGIKYTPGKADVSDKVFSRTDTAVGKGTAGSTTGEVTYTAQAEVENYTNLYVDIPLYNNFFVKAGWSRIDVNTLETSTKTTTGTYGNKTIDGVNYGIGLKGEYEKVIWKLAYEATNFQELSLSSSTNNSIKANLDTSEVNLSVGYKF